MLLSLGKGSYFKDWVNTRGIDLIHKINQKSEETGYNFSHSSGKKEINNKCQSATPTYFSCCSLIKDSLSWLIFCFKDLTSFSN